MNFTSRLILNAEKQLNTFEIYLVEEFFRSDFEQTKEGYAKYLLDLWTKELIFKTEYDNLIMIVGE